MGRYHIDIGQKTIQKAMAHPAERDRQCGMLSFLVKRKGATYLSNNKKGGEIARVLACFQAGPAARNQEIFAGAALDLG